MKTAKLSSTLLVQKGLAGPTGAPVPDNDQLDLLPEPESADAEQVAARTARNVQQQAQSLRDAFAAAPRQSRRVNLSFRLDKDRHHRLKVAAAHANRSAQDILMSALDDYLDQMAGAYMDGSCNCLAKETDADRHPGLVPGVAGASRSA